MIVLKRMYHTGYHIKQIIVLMAALLALSCNQKTFDTEKELLEYITDEANGYIQKKSVNGYDFSLLYRPTDLLVKQELSSDEVSKSKIDSLRKKYDNYLYFNLSMSRNNQELLNSQAGDRNAFGAMVNQLAFGMGEKVHLYTQSKDTLELADFVYPRMYGMSRSTTIMFVYPRDEEKLKASTERSRSEEFLNFTVEDLGIYTGEIKFKIKTDKLNNEPQLNFVNTL